MGWRWKTVKIPRLNGLDLKSSVTEVKNGRSLDCLNVYQKFSGQVGLRPGTEAMFSADEAGTVANDELGTTMIAGTKYYFKFSNGKFSYATSRTGAVTVLSPSPAISTTLPIWFLTIDDKLFFVDGTNALRYFNGTAISSSVILQRPTVALTTASGGTGYDYTYTVDNTLGESPACATLLTNKGTLGTVTVTGNTGPQTLAIGDKIRIYSKVTTVAAASKNVTPVSGAHANGTYGTDTSGGYLLLSSTAATYDIVTVAVSDTTPQLYSELGVALNKSAVTALEGITEHYGRIVGWKGSSVYNSKSSNPHSWPDDSAQKEAFVYGFKDGDGESISVCVSYRESLYVLKPSSAAVFGGTGPDDTGNNAYSFRRLQVNGRGCVAGKSAVVIGEKTDLYLVYLSSYGFMATTGSEPVEIGEAIETQIQGITASTLATAVAYHDKNLGLYVSFVGGPSARTGWVFDVRKDQGQDQEHVGWFKFSGLNATHCFWDFDRALYGLSSGVCLSQRVAGIPSDFSDAGQEYVATGAVNTSTEEITVARSYQTGDTVIVRSSGGVPAGLTANTVYFAIRVSATVIKLATTAALATAGTAINLTSQGSGTHSLISKTLITNYYTTNWLSMGSPLVTKKLGKLGLIINALATNVVMQISSAYNYVNTFQNMLTLEPSGGEEWGGDTFGSFVWGSGSEAAPKNLAIPRRKVKSIRFKFAVAVIEKDFELLGIELPYDNIRNRGGFS